MRGKLCHDWLRTATYAYSSHFGDDASRAFGVFVFFVFLLGVGVLRVAASVESRAEGKTVLLAAGPRTTTPPECNARG